MSALPHNIPWAPLGYQAPAPAPTPGMARNADRLWSGSLRTLGPLILLAGAWLLLRR